MQAKILPEDEQRILALAGAGKTNRQIAAELGGKVAHTSISRFLARSRTSRADVAKVLVREQLVTGLPTDLERLEREAARLAAICSVLGDKIEAGTAREQETIRYMRAVDRLAKLTDLKLHYAGADTPDEPREDDGAAERVMAKISSLLDRGEPTVMPSTPAEPTAGSSCAD